MVMVRDISHAVRISGQSTVIASVVLDVDTGRMHGVSAGSTSQDACQDALTKAVTRATELHEPVPPEQLLCGEDHVEAVGARLEQVFGAQRVPSVVEVVPGNEAEDIVDSLVGHMAGRRQPDEFPNQDDWYLFFALADQYRQAAPWERWSDAVRLDLVLTVDDVAARYVAVVLGQAGIQHGLVLYPGDAVSDELRDWQPQDPVSVPDGTLLCHFEPPTDAPAEYVAKAVRYGWPADADSMPVSLVGGPDGPGDLARRDTRHLTLGFAAVLDWDRDSQPEAATTGQLGFPDGSHGEYEVHQT
ncbi:hypothetical protein EF847_21935 [Actinobacteria bacterium YIM 96077]|uniref:Uncharacterized protein n=2 Tax=Phytoactinopolyspora halophila TaxID=1981511 RepID=A0A329QSN6_9ACTN|nr:hypothetical protein EF847_21935 [Actinobacteria bacterium YIM 96077]RAW15410.1 hypothetical protein DPM12_09165 [Phytoactinopolyspora halophila]